MSAEKALRESEERFRLTIDEAPIGMALVSLDGRFVRVNRAFCAVVGYEPAELAKLTFQEITHPEHVARQELARVERDLTAGRDPAPDADGSRAQARRLFR